jgi:hypothetical protein
LQQLHKNCNPTQPQLLAFGLSNRTSYNQLQPVAAQPHNQADFLMKSSPRTPKMVKNEQVMAKTVVFLISSVIFDHFFTDMECTSMEIHYIHHRALFIACPDQLQLQLSCIFCMTSYDQLWPVAVAVVENFFIWQLVVVAVGPNMAQQPDPTGPHISNHRQA